MSLVYFKHDIYILILVILKLRNIVVRFNIFQVYVIVLNKMKHIHGVIFMLKNLMIGYLFLSCATDIAFSQLKC